MTSLYGITTEDACLAEMDEILELNQRAMLTLRKETVEAVNSRLADCYSKGDSVRRQEQMSPIEKAFFWPAVQEAYVKRPKFPRVLKSSSRASQLQISNI
jgi:hypothetical protein